MKNTPLVTPVREAHRIDETRLAEYLDGQLEGFTGPLVVRQFEGGQSNPTYLLEANHRKWVLRRKPPGPLLPSAHQVDREYRVMKALEGSEVPVPKMRLLCQDESIIGAVFFVMDHIPGRVLRNMTMPDFTPGERRAVFSDMNRVLAALHTRDYQAIGLEGFGKTGSYYDRQISRWSRQYLAAQTEPIKEMDLLMEHLPRLVPQTEAVGVIHGDYRLENLLIHPTEPRVVAVLDWELSTLGHPLGDLAYNCLGYHYRQPGTDCSLSDIAGKQTGIPTEEEYLGWYCERTGRASIENWNFYLSFAVFRLASILQGVLKRGLQGNASSDTALERGGLARQTAEMAWDFIKDQL